MKAAKRGRKQAAQNQPPPRDAATAPQPLKPRRGLFIILMIVLALWMIVLVSMYFFTISV